MQHVNTTCNALSRRNVISHGVLPAAMIAAVGAESAFGQTATTKGTTMQLTQDWDRTFPKSSKVDYQKVAFTNRYGITFAPPHGGGLVRRMVRQRARLNVHGRGSRLMRTDMGVHSR
jgi:hypothetical protein